MIAFIDYRTSNEEINSLKNLNIDVNDCFISDEYSTSIPCNNNLYPAINGHVDIQLNILNSDTKTIILNKDIDNNFKKILQEKEINFINSFNSLNKNYPENISLNAYITQNYLIHNLNFTDKEIINYCKTKKQIHIKQGYSKCSILPLREKVVITSDMGIYKTLIKENFDVLLIPFGDIELPGLNYGFIGGVGGMISSNSMAFFGSLEKYAFCDEVKKFLYKYDIKPIYLRATGRTDKSL